MIFSPKMMDQPLYYKYWGKARQNETGNGFEYHLLPYHCLDVAAVGWEWLELDNSLSSGIAYSIGMEKDDQRLFKTICFFLALHDFGKYDIRFQSKVPEIRNTTWIGLDQEDLMLSEAHIAGFDHGKAGYAAFVKFYPELLCLSERNEDLLDRWKPWVAAVTGHHGVIPLHADWHNPCTEEGVIKHDKRARSEWIQSLSALFLSNDLDIPFLSEAAQPFIAGFCSVADWIASNEYFVRWVDNNLKLEHYFDEAKEQCRKTDILLKTGLVGSKSSAYKGVSALLPEKMPPRQIQTLVDDLPLCTGLQIVEAPTGSGKTEAAIALAWKLIAAGLADSIVFALPTQATADAMLERVQKLAPVLFEGSDANLVLAHGKAKYNSTFANLKAAARPGAGQKGNEGSVQCAEWISSSRKRVFLGQIGICTIDQVLLSVLPVRHNFVRSFGVMKSVLIIDEVHAYDRYMYGLIEEVLKRQKAAGGSVILLSATLPAVQKRELFEAWHRDGGISIEADAPYPLFNTISVTGAPSIRTVAKKEMPPERAVRVEIVPSKDMEPDEAIFDNLLTAAKAGANVAVVCNLVQSAQRIAQRLRAITAGTPIPVDIFHARYRFKDRQIKERAVKNMYGINSLRAIGRILVATQVVEQSLDLDFDWLVSQLCPVDLLFQRMGRLHRHERNRPIGFENPLCTILSTASNDFGAHEYIYGDVRILWRTRELLNSCDNKILFPEAYRTWIEAAYGREDWEGTAEPDSIIGKSCAFRQDQQRLRYEAQQRATTGMNPFADTDQNSASLTRGKELGLNMVPIISGRTERVLLDDECLSEINEFERAELLNMNAISVPAWWKKWLPPFEDGYIYLPMRQEDNGWKWENGIFSLKYSTDLGLERWGAIDEPAE